MTTEPTGADPTGAKPAGAMPSQAKPTRHFLNKIVPPRVTFPADMSADEAAAMARHAAYWADLTAQGRVVAFGPVLEPPGSWGLALIEAGTAEEADQMAAADPVVVSGLFTYQVFSMPRAVVRGA